jgi:putative lipoprotein (rSAM/lipoprotein system)
MYIFVQRFNQVTHLYKVEFYMQKEMNTAKQFRRRLFRGMNWLLAGMLSLLGFGCFESKEPTEYGTPSADYTVKGKVVDKATGKPVKGIRVGYTPDQLAVPEYGVPVKSFRQMTAADTTDLKGEFSITEQTFPVDEPVSVYFNDTDGTENGFYPPEKLTVNFKEAGQTGKPDKWYEGEFTVTLNVELESLTPHE